MRVKATKAFPRDPRIQIVINRAISNTSSHDRVSTKPKILLLLHVSLQCFFTCNERFGSERAVGGNVVVVVDMVAKVWPNPGRLPRVVVQDNQVEGARNLGRL